MRTKNDITARELTADVLDRVIRNITLMPDGCWRWDGSLTPTGYGRIGIGGRLANGGKRIRAHRVTWVWLRGPIPDGLELDHLCRNTRCVNPDHLEPVTHRVNIQRGYASETHCRRGHRRTPENTYTHPAGSGCRECIRLLDRNRRRAYRRQRREV